MNDPRGGSGPRRWRRACAGALRVALLALLTACQGPRTKVQTDAVRYVRFEGNGGLFSGHNDLQLRTAMSQRASPPFTFVFPFMYFVQPAELSLDTLHADARRLEVWYAHHGYFDAQVKGWAIRRVRQRREDRAGVVDVVGNVVPGPRSVLREISFVTEGDAPSAIRKTIERRGDLAVGDPFDLDTVHAVRDAWRDALLDAGYAYARVEADISAYPDEGVVDVKLTAWSGIKAYVSRVEIDGVSRVDVADVLDTLSFDVVTAEELAERRGRCFALSAKAQREDPVCREVNRRAEKAAFSTSALRRSQASLFETELFSLVDLRPDLSDPTSELLPVRIKLQEAKFRRFRVGAGLQFDYFNLTPRVDLIYRDVRFAGSKLELDARAGVGAVVGVVRGDDSAPVEYLLTGLGELSFSYPWALRRRLAVTASASFEQDVQFGNLPYQELNAHVGLSYKVSETVRLTGGPVFQYFQYLNPSSDTLQAARLTFGGDFTGSVYRLLSLDLGLQYDNRTNRDPSKPTMRGRAASLRLRQSIPIPTFEDPRGLESSFRYFKATGNMRAWTRLFPGRFRGSSRALVLGGKLGGEALVPLRDGLPLPYPDLVFLGGPNSLRGYRSDAVGPYDAICSYANGRPIPQHDNGERTRVDRTYIPRGGTVGAEGIVELRYDWAYDLSFAVFGDGGFLWQRAASSPTGAGHMAWGAGGGVGLRYNSPIGPIRVDVGLRPTHPWDLGRPFDATSPDATATRYFGCNPVDVLPRGYDLASSSLAARHALAAGDDGLPIGINLFIAIGEAF